MKQWHGNLLLSVISIVVVLGIAELATRIVWAEPTHYLYQILPGGMHMMPNTTGVYKSQEFEFTVNSNRFGHRDWNWTDAVMKDRCNYVFIGDSFVFGYGVDDQYTVPTQLEAELAKGGPKREVFNLGLGGGFPEYRILTQEAIEKEGIAAGTILIGIFLGNDFTPEPVYQKADSGKGGLMSHLRAPRPDDSALYRFFKVRASGSEAFTGLVFRAGRLMHRNWYPTGTGYIFLREWTPDQEQLFHSFLDRSLDIDTIARDHGRRVGFVIFPNRIQVENAADLTSAVYDAALPDKRIMDFCGQHGLSCIDMLPTLTAAYQRDHKPLFFPVDRHMNPAGNHLAAVRIAEFLRTQPPCDAPDRQPAALAASRE